MMDERALLNALEACLQEEVVATRRVSDSIVAQEESIKVGEPERLEEVTKELEKELQGNLQRSLRRSTILEGLARVWNVPASAMTLSSIGERAGNGAGRMSLLRDQLRKAISEVVRANRRVAALTSLRRQVASDVLQALVGSGEINPMRASGSLVNAEA